MTLQAPHKAIEVRDARERFLVELLDSLWARYRERVEFARCYEKIVADHGAVFVNDHVAFRTIASQSPAAGIFSIARIFEALGYRAAATYDFPDKKLSSIHYQHDNARFPKLFITELRAWELSPAARRIAGRVLSRHHAPLPESALAALNDLEHQTAPNRRALARQISRFFEELPWEVPRKKDVLSLNEESQFGAWVLVNGYDVNHFTASVTSHGVPSLADIDRTVAAMREAGVPMKKEIEGEPGSRLRQTSTEAVMSRVRVREGTRTVRMPWTYAYFEIAERPLVKNPATGRPERFEGFLGGQATNLFDMTKVR